MVRARGAVLVAAVVPLIVFCIAVLMFLWVVFLLWFAGTVIF